MVGGDADNAGTRREPELPKHEEIALEPPKAANEFDLRGEEPDEDAHRLQILQRQARYVARQAARRCSDVDGVGCRCSRPKTSKYLELA
jgi:type IV secretion system protein VirD4